MENLAAKMFSTYMENMKTPVTVVHEDENVTVLRVGWQLKNTRASMLFVFASNNANVQIRAQEFAFFPAEKKDIMYKTCSEINSSFRWVKFFVDEENNEIIAEDDAVIQLESCAEEVIELMLRMNGIIDDAYPTFMKALYA